MNSNKTSTFSEMSKAEYELGYAADNLRKAQKAHKTELMNECVQNILEVQTERGVLTERELMIFVKDLVSKISDIQTR